MRSVKEVDGGMGVVALVRLGGDVVEELSLILVDVVLSAI